MEKKSEFWFGRVEVRKMGKGWQLVYLILAIVGGLLGVCITMALFGFQFAQVQRIDLLYAGLIYIAMYGFVFLVTIKKYYKMRKEE